MLSAEGQSQPASAPVMGSMPAGATTAMPIATTPPTLADKYEYARNSVKMLANKLRAGLKSNEELATQLEAAREELQQAHERGEPLLSRRDRPLCLPVGAASSAPTVISHGAVDR